METTKDNSNIIDLTVHNSCYCALDLLCLWVMALFQGFLHFYFIPFSFYVKLLSLWFLHASLQAIAWNKMVFKLPRPLPPSLRPPIPGSIFFVAKNICCSFFKCASCGLNFTVLMHFLNCLFVFENCLVLSKEVWVEVRK